MTEEAVFHPAHYGGADNPYEVIKVMEAWLTPEEFRGALKFNIHKYLARATKKGRGQDYAKAAWYSNYLGEYESRHPTPDDSAVARQLSRSMELNAKMKNAVRVALESLGGVFAGSAGNGNGSAGGSAGGSGGGGGAGGSASGGMISATERLRIQLAEILRLS